ILPCFIASKTRKREAILVKEAGSMASSAFCSKSTVPVETSTRMASRAFIWPGEISVAEEVPLAGSPCPCLGPDFFVPVSFPAAGCPCVFFAAPSSAGAEEGMPTKSKQSPSSSQKKYFLCIYFLSGVRILFFKKGFRCRCSYTANPLLFQYWEFSAVFCPTQAKIPVKSAD